MYSKYANPKELISMHIKNRRFGKFVEKLIASENKRKREEAEKEDDQKWWMMYVRIMPDKSFIEWKNELLMHQTKPKELSVNDENMTDADIEKIINDLFPEKKEGGEPL